MFSPYMYNQNAGNECFVGVWKGTVGSGTLLVSARQTSQAANEGAPLSMSGYDFPASASNTYNAGIHAFGAGNASLNAAIGGGNDFAAALLVELV